MRPEFTGVTASVTNCTVDLFLTKKADVVILLRQPNPALNGLLVRCDDFSRCRSILNLPCFELIIACMMNKHKRDLLCFVPKPSGSKLATVLKGLGFVIC